MSKKIILWILAVCVCIAAGAVSYALSLHGLCISNYEINAEEGANLRIAFLADLHNNTFGTDNDRLLSRVSEQAPDLIVIAGDLINSDSDEQNLDTACQLLTDLGRIAPVYLSYGNHEKEYEQLHSVDLKEIFSETGSIVLDRDYLDVDVNGSPLRIGGIYGYCLPEKYGVEARAEETTFLKDFQDTDRYTILLTHMPVCWMKNDGLEEWDVDLVLSGHVHGGQVIIPFVGGLYGPDFGWFPGKLYGKFDSADRERSLVVTKGLGSHEKIPRFNNIPEIVTVEIHP